eukprot:8907305-Alexandrium_andersonii.AAC.1
MCIRDRLRLHQSVQGGRPMTTCGRWDPRARMARSWSSARSKPREAPPGPGRKSNAPAGGTP